MTVAAGQRNDLLIGLVAAFGALAGRLTLIRDFGTTLPYQDHWRVTAVDVLEPWLDGRLSLQSFFVSANDHVDALGRIYSLLLILANGQWNNLLEITCNALFYALVVHLLVASLAPAMGRTPAVVFALVAGLVLGLPYSWENTLFGLQINVLLEIALSLCYLRATAIATPWTVGWWIGQIAAGLVLLTQRSGVLVFAPVSIMLLWRLARGEGERRANLAGLAIAAGWLLASLWLLPPFAVTAGMKADSWRLALEAGLRQLAWPLPHPGWALLLHLPLAWLAWDRIGRRNFSRIETFVAMLGLWVMAYAAAIGYGRGAVSVGFVSRYTDFLALGLVANGACLVFLGQSVTGWRARGSWWLLVVAWAGCCSWGLWRESVSGHAGYNLDRRLVMNETNLGAVREYLATGNPASLSQEKIGETLYSYPPTLIALLGKPGLRALLPPETGAAEARPDHGRLGAVLLPGLRFGPVLAAGAALILSLLVLRGREAPAAPAVAPPRSQWTKLQIAGLGGLATCLVWGVLLAWEKPFHFSTRERWTAIMSHPGAGVVPVPLDFSSTVGRPVASRELNGAAAVEPALLRSQLFGTLLEEGTDYTGIVCSAPVTLERRFLVALVAGWPNWPGNGIRWHVEDPGTGAKAMLPVLGLPSEPGNTVSLWSVPVAQYRGWHARLFLFDGTAGAPGWVGISRPMMTDDPDFGSRWITLVQGERAESTHRLLGGLAALSTLAWLAVALGWLRRKPSAGRP